MSDSEKPKPSSNPEALGPLDMLEPLTPEGVSTLRTLQEVVMKKGVDIVDSPTAMEDLKPRLGEPGYFFDVLNEYTPTELGEGDTIGRGFYHTELIRAPDDNDVDIDLRILIPIGPRMDHKGRRLLANCWLDLTSYPDRYLGVVMRFYSTNGKAGSVPMVETQMDLNYALGSDRERKMAIQDFVSARPVIAPILDDLGLLSAIDDRFDKFKLPQANNRELVKLEYIKQDEIELDLFNAKIKEVVESK